MDYPAWTGVEGVKDTRAGGPAVRHRDLKDSGDEHGH